MGQIEKRVRKRVRRARIQDAVLLSLRGVALISVAVAVPQAIRTLKLIDPGFGKKRRPEDRVKQALRRLEMRGLITRDEQGKLTVTERGEKQAAILHAKEVLAVRRPKSWDGRWRIIVFDVWETRKAVRQQFRMLLEKIGFVKLQNSVWVFPYDCEDVIALLKTEMRLGGSVFYIVAEEIENDAPLRRHFQLP